MSAGSYSCDVGGVNIYGRSRTLESPYADYASRYVPKSFSDVIDWSEHVTTLNDDLGVGLRKLYTYFATPVDVGVLDLDDKEHDSQNTLKWEMMLRQQLDHLSHVTQLGLNVGTYGNDFITVTLRHQRYIQCPRCYNELLLSEVQSYKSMDFKFSKMVFSGFCPSPLCKGRDRVKFGIRHNALTQADQLIIKHWPIRELEFDYDEATDDLVIYWRIPNRIKDKVLKDADPQALHNWDMGVLQAICENRLLKFDDKVMHHAKEPHLSGLDNRGLGIPRTLSLARQHWMIQLLKKQCQALSQEYVTPMKFFSLDGGGSGMGAMDGVAQSDARIFANYVEQMISEHRQDPTKSYYVPFPMKFQYAGGGADQFVPANLLQLASSDLSASLVPAPMLRGELNAQGAPMFLRTFEAFHREIPQMYNRYLWFVCARASELLKLESIGCIHQSAAMADNIGVDSMLMQAASMGKISDLPWMRRLGLNPKTERNRQVTEARDEIEKMKKIQKIQEETDYQSLVQQGASSSMVQAAQPADPQQQQQGGGGMQTPGMLPSGNITLPSAGYQPPNDIAQMEAEAEVMAATLGMLDQSNRNHELSLLRESNSAFHSLVMSALDKLRSQTELQARQMVAPTL